MSKITLSPTEKEIILRMINYRGKDDIKIYVLQNSKKGQTYMPKDEGLFSVNDIRYNIKQKYRKLLRGSEQLIADNGWLIADLIEWPKSPYSDNSRYKKKRWDYLEKSLSDEKELLTCREFKYIDSKGGSRSKKVYKLSNFADLFDFFYNEPGQPNFKTFLKSDFYLEHKNQIIEQIFMNFEDKDLLKVADVVQYLQDSPIISPSFVLSTLNDPFKGRVEWCIDNLMLDYGFVEVYRSFLMYDAVNCADLELRKQYFDLIAQLSKIKKHGGLRTNLRAKALRE